MLKFLFIVATIGSWLDIICGESVVTCTSNLYAKNTLNSDYKNSGCRAALDFPSSGGKYHSGKISGTTFEPQYYAYVIDMFTSSKEAIDSISHYEDKGINLYTFDHLMKAFGWTHDSTTKPRCMAAVALAVCTAGAPPCGKDGTFRMPCTVCQNLKSVDGPCGDFFSRGNIISTRVDYADSEQKLEIDKLHEIAKIDFLDSVVTTSLIVEILKFAFATLEMGCTTDECKACDYSWHVYDCKYSLPRNGSDYYGGSLPSSESISISSFGSIPYKNCSVFNVSRQCPTPANRTTTTVAPPSIFTSSTTTTMQSATTTTKPPDEFVQTNLTGKNISDFVTCDPLVKPLACWMSDAPVSLGNLFSYCAVKIVPGQNTTSAQYNVIMDMFFEVGFEQIAKSWLASSQDSEKCKTLLKRALCPILAPPCNNDCRPKRVPCAWCTALFQTPNDCFRSSRISGDLNASQLATKLEEMDDSVFQTLNGLKTLYKAYTSATAKACTSCIWSEEEQIALTPELIKSTLIYVFTELEQSCYKGGGGAECNGIVTNLQGETRTSIFDPTIVASEFGKLYRSNGVCPMGDSCANHTIVSNTSQTAEENEEKKDVFYMEVENTNECTHAIEPLICHDKDFPVSGGEKIPFCAVKQLPGAPFTTAQYITIIDLVWKLKGLFLEQLKLSADDEVCVDLLKRIICFAGAPPCGGDCARKKIPCQWCIDLFKNPKCRMDKLPSSANITKSIREVENSQLGILITMKSSYQSTAWLPKDEYDGINAELLKETLVYAFSILAGACNEKSCTSESGLPATVFDPELELRSNSLALQMPSCPRPSQCSGAVAHVTFELKLVGINRNDFDHENYKDGLVNFFNSFLPANIINAADIAIEVVSGNRRRLVTNELRVKATVTVPNKVYQPSGESGNSITLWNIVQDAVNDVSTDGTKLMQELAKVDLHVTSVIVTEKASSKLQFNDADENVKVEQPKPEGLSMVAIGIIIVVVFLLCIIGAFVARKKTLQSDTKNLATEKVIKGLPIVKGIGASETFCSVNEGQVVYSNPLRGDVQLIERMNSKSTRPKNRAQL